MQVTSSLTIAALTLNALILQAAMLPGTKHEDYPANPEKHVITITREAETEIGKKMIEKAETAKPDTGVWWNVKEDNADGKAEDNADVNAETNAVRVMGLKTPYALTADALKYYADQIKGYQKKAWESRVREPASKLEYSAKVGRHEIFTLDGKEYKDVYVVTMKMVFQTSLTVEAYGGTRFQKQRTVVLDSDGKVLVIAGDKEEPFFMWMM